MTDAITKRREVKEFIGQINKCCKGEASIEDAFPLKYQGLLPSSIGDWSTAIVYQLVMMGHQPLVSYRQGDDDFIIVDYSHGAFDLNYRCRAVALYMKLRKASGDITFSSGLHTGMACGNSLMLYYDGLRIPREKLLGLESELGDRSIAKMSSRRFRLLTTFSSKKPASNDTLRRSAPALLISQIQWTSSPKTMPSRNSNFRMCFYMQA